TQKAIGKHAKLINKISAERIKAELDKILASNRASIGLGLLDIVGLLEHVLPEIKNMQGVTQPRNEHSEGDVYAHSLLALEKPDETFDLPTRWAVLLHDVGKPQTRLIRDGKITFYEHMQVGEEIAKKLCKRLKFSNHEADKIAWLVRNHMVPNDFKHMKLSTRRKWALNPHFLDLLRVFKADASASLPGKKGARPTLAAYKLGLKMIEDIKKQPMLTKPIISGNDVMNILKIKEGPLVGRALKLVEEAKLAGQISTKDQAAKYLLKQKGRIK
ncbi:MAG: HD domain-containing protein, partial [bacterium]|nr:HD domain-containing protein [bacterium]